MSIKEFYDKNGYVILKKAIPDELIEKYEKVWMQHVSDRRDERGNLEGWGNDFDVYLDHPEIMDILCHDSIARTFVDVNKAVALHKNVTDFVSTEQGWHQDAAFAYREAGENYQGAWVALEDIGPEAGPFEIVPGSHNWDCDLTVLYPDIKDQPGQLREGVRSHDFFEKEIEKRGAEMVSFIAEKGDVIIWHGHLVHRGSMPQNRNITRKSLIGHYCNLFANTSVTPDDKQWYEQSETVRNQMVSEYSDLFAKWGEGIYFRTP
jgi:ectoine hydroxylase-related dioxygenase (phytanoyl-CoA dioxygenase family)